MLEKRLEELGSAIINYKSNNSVELIGFYSPEMLLLGEKSLENKLSHGFYDYEKINHFKIKDDFILVVKKDNQEINRYKFKTLKRMQLNFKDKKNQNRSKLYSIRKCSYTKLYNYIDVEDSLIFDTYEDLINYLNRNYNITSNINI